MEEKSMLLELKRDMEFQLRLLEEEILFSDPFGNDEEYSFLLKKAVSYRDVLKRIEQRLSDL